MRGCLTQNKTALKRCTYAHVRSATAFRAAIAAKAAAAPTVVTTPQKLLYDGIALDMDGTLTSCVIDFRDMRKRTGIPVGDLFVAMESWEEPDDIKASMDVILEIEAAASNNISAKEGLLELLQYLKDSEVRVALVTRNTLQSVDAFFNLVGQEWRQLFSEIRTREFKYVKPDKRLLLELTEVWGIHPGKLLMVGDSHEDVECGNAAGTATCLIAGGGNEVGGSNVPPAGAVPTFSVTRLPELTQFLKDTASPTDSLDALAAGCLQGVDQRADLLGWSLRSGSMSSSDEESEQSPTGTLQLPLDPNSPGAPALGLDFFDFLVDEGAVQLASTSFPRMGAAAGGLAACSQGGGDSLVHVGCGDGALTKMLASKGLRVFGVDVSIEAAAKRGLRCTAYQGLPLSTGSLAAAAAAAGGTVDVVLLFTAPQVSSKGDNFSKSGDYPITSKECFQLEALQELSRLLSPGGRLCLEVPIAEGDDAAAVLTSLLQQAPAAGFKSTSHAQVVPGAYQERVRVIAQRDV